MWSSILLVLLGTVIYRIVGIRRSLNDVARLPGMRPFFGTFTAFGALIPTNYFNPGLIWTWCWRSYIYQSYGSRTISLVSLWPGIPMVCTGSYDVAKQILNAGPSIYKSPESFKALMLWGNNIVASDFDLYKKHRRIVGPAFSPTTYAFVADETIRTYNEMVEGEGWSQKTEVIVQNIDQVISKFTLCIVARCGFGMPFPWVSQECGDDMSFAKALGITVSASILRLVTPEWAYSLPIKYLREVNQATITLTRLMKSLVASKKEALEMDKPEREGRDLFTRLVAASKAEGKDGLEESDIIGDVFSFLFAGQDTTAHVFTATLAFLALYEEEQDKAYKYILEALPDDKIPTFGDLPLLDKVTACFYEAARLYPPASMILRDTAETFVLTLPENGRNVAIAPGVRLMVDVVGIHYDPDRFPDPEHFDPSRWYDVNELDIAFFGLGPRSCIGRKFAITEATCLLAVMLREWKIQLCLKEGETKAEWRERSMQGCFLGMTFGVKNISLKLVRRAQV